MLRVLEVMTVDCPPLLLDQELHHGLYECVRDEPVGVAVEEKDRMVPRFRLQCGVRYPIVEFRIPLPVLE